MKKLLWIVLIVFCLTLTACRAPEQEDISTQTPAEQPTVSAQTQTQEEKEAQTADEPAVDSPTEEAETQTTAKQEKNVITVSGSKALISQEDLTSGADLILRGRVKSKTGELMLNPDGKKTDASGQVIPNEQITSYELEIYELYKGEYAETTMVVKTSNGRNLSPELILYGEDENNVLSQPLSRFDLTVGQDCILYLTKVESELAEKAGYYPFRGKAGYFPKSDDGVYQNKGALPLTNTPQQLADNAVK